MKRSIVCCAIAALLLSTSVAFAVSLNSKANELSGLETQVKTLQQQYANPLANTRFYTLQRRIIDAQIQYELKDYERASMLFTDALTFKGIERTRDYVPVLVQLGQCHYNIKNYKTAVEVLTKAYSRASGDLRQKALYYLVEIALETRDRKTLHQLFAVLKRYNPSSMRADIHYVYGKALYELGEVLKANQIFSAIRANSPFYLKAAYFRAVILVRKGLLKPALQLFKAITKAKKNPKDKSVRQVVELAHLSLGRLHYELKQYALALDHYQEISRQSPQFEPALFEISWVFIRQKNYKKALDALDVLLLVSEDNALAIQANILKGRLNIMLNDYSSATDTFKDLVTRFEPIRSELARLKKDKRRLAQYFRSLLFKKTDKIGLEKVLSDKAAKWVESDENMLRIVSLFGRMSKDKKDVEETLKTIKLIEQALREPNRVKIFPALKKGYSSVLEVQNRLILVNKYLLDYELPLVKNHVDPKDQSTLARMTAERHAMERQLMQIPLTVKGLTRRTQTITNKYQDLKREARLAETNLALIRKQLDAIDRYLQNRSAKNPGRKETGPTKEVKRNLTEERKRLRGLFTRLTSLKDSIDRQMRRVGTGDFVVRSESNLKRKLVRLQQRDGAFLKRYRTNYGSKQRSTIEKLHRLRRRVWDNMTVLDNILVRIEQKIDEKVRYFRVILASEKKKSIRYQNVVRSYESDSRVLSGEIGSKQFELVYMKLSNIILEADVGIIDVAWKKKKEESNKIRKLQEDQRKMLLNLRRNFNALIQGKE